MIVGRSCTSRSICVCSSRDLGRVITDVSVLLGVFLEQGDAVHLPVHQLGAELGDDRVDLEVLGALDHFRLGRDLLADRPHALLGPHDAGAHVAQRRRDVVDGPDRRHEFLLGRHDVIVAREHRQGIFRLAHALFEEALLLVIEARQAFVAVDARVVREVLVHHPVDHQGRVRRLRGTVVNLNHVRGLDRRDRQRARQAEHLFTETRSLIAPDGPGPVPQEREIAHDVLEDLTAADHVHLGVDERFVEPNVVESGDVRWLHRGIGALRRDHHLGRGHEARLAHQHRHDARQGDRQEDGGDQALALEHDVQNVANLFVGVESAGAPAPVRPLQVHVAVNVGVAVAAVAGQVRAISSWGFVRHYSYVEGVNR